MIYACGGAVSLAAGATAVGIFGLPAPWAVAIILALLMAAVFEGGYRANARLRVELEEWKARAVSLPSRLDALLGEGMAILRDLPAEPPAATTENGFKVPLVPDASYRERIVKFDKRVRELLEEQRPSLLPAYSEGANRVRRREAEKQTAQELDDEASDARKLKQFFDDAHAGPAMELEALLTGLSDARNQLGHSA